MRTLRTLVETLAETIRPGASVDLSDLWFELDANDNIEDLAHGRS